MAYEIEEIGRIPSDFLSPEVKASKEYALKFAQATDRTDNNAGVVNWQKRYDLLRAYARGDQPIDKYKPILGVRNKKVKADPFNESYKVLNWEILDIATKYVNVLIGKVVKRDNSIGVKAIDKAAQNQRRLKKIELQASIINQPLLEDITKVTGIPFEGPTQTDVIPPPENLGEVDIHQEMFYKEDYCIIAQDMLKEVNEQDNYQDILMEVARDLTEIGMGATKCYRVGNKIRRRRCIPERMGMSSSSKSNYEDAKYVYEDWDMTIGQLKEIAGDQFTEEVYRKIAEKITDVNYNSYNIADYYDKNLCYPWDNTKITVRDLIWFSPDWETQQIQKTDLGDVSIVEKQYDWWEEQRMNKMTEQKFNQQNPNSQIIRYSLDNQYQCMWIKNTKYVFNFGKSKDMLKNESNLGRTVSPYTIYKLKKSPVEVIMPVLDNIQLNWLQYQHHIAKSRPLGLDIEFIALQDISLEGPAGTRLKPKEVLRLYFDTGIILWRRKDSLGNNSNFRPINELKNGLNPAALEHLNLIITNINLLRDQIGMNELTDGSTPNSEMGKAVAGIAVDATDDALRPMYFGFDQINLLTHEKTLMHISGMASTGLAPHYSEAVGLEGMGLLAFLSDMTHHEMGVYLMRQPTFEMRTRLTMYIQEGLKAGTLFTYEAMEIEMEDNIYRAIRLLKMYQAQKEKKATAQQRQMYQMEQQKNEASAQATAQATAQNDQLDWQNKSNYEWSRAQAEVWADKQKTGNQALLLQLQNKLATGQKLTELEEKRLTELMVVDRKGAWDAKIASMKPAPTSTSKKK